MAPQRQSSPSRSLHRQLHSLARQHALGRVAIAACTFAALGIGSALISQLGTRSTPTMHRLRTLDTEPEGGGRACTDASRVPLYVFLHLHKTGGNALKRVLFSFAKRNALVLHHTCRTTSGDSWLAAWWFARRKKADSFDCNLDAVSAMSTAQRDRIDIIVGHQYMGVHSLFPQRDVRYFTMMRNPVSRKLSHFAHFERNNTDMLQYLIERNRNYMTKRLASNDVCSELCCELRSQFIDMERFAMQAALRAALQNLERFFFVGLQERYQQSVCVLASILNNACGRRGRLAQYARMATWVKGNGTRRRIRREVRREIIRAESADMQLFRAAEKLFERKLAMYAECSGW